MGGFTVSRRRAEDFFKKVGVLSLFFFQVVAFFFTRKNNRSKKKICGFTFHQSSSKVVSGNHVREYERNSSNSWILFGSPWIFTDLPLFCFDIFFCDNPFEAWKQHPQVFLTILFQGLHEQTEIFVTMPISLG